MIAAKVLVVAVLVLLAVLSLLLGMRAAADPTMGSGPRAAACLVCTLFFVCCAVGIAGLS